MKRILFVDDEVRVLDGLRRSLYDMRKEWSLTFANSASAALEELERAPFDVVVSDMRMPVMDGAEFLRKAASMRPEAARIVLSGQMEDAVATRAAGVAHRFLTKPCDPQTLKAAVARALELQARLGSAELKRCIASMVALPSLPSACVAINEAIADDRNSIADICAVIQDDVGMAANVLKLVNSAFFGLSRRITDIHEAVSFLGINTIRGLVLAHSLFHVFEGADAVDAEAVLEHSRLASRIARQLLDDPHLSEVAATGALLHDAGALALASQLPAEYREVVSEARRRRAPLHEVERERFGVTHADIGAYLLGLWGLPHEVLDAVASHHAPFPTDGPFDAPTAVRIALVVADRIASGVDVGRADASLPTDVVERLGIRLKLAAIETHTRDLVHREVAA